MSARADGRPILLFLDWDSTLTERTTLPLIASIATYPKQHPQLVDLSKSYDHDLNVHDAAYRPPASFRKALNQEVEYLNSLGVVEKASIARIEDSGIFKSVKPSDIEHVATSCIEDGVIRLRKGWERLIDLIHHSEYEKRRGEVHIISVAWSASFISSCIQTALNKLACHHASRDYHIVIHANDIDMRYGRLLGLGSLDDSLILTATDKLRIMRNTILGYKNADSHQKLATVFMGDSSTDLACLLEADIGVFVRDREIGREQKQLKDALNRLNIDVCPISKYNVDKRNDENRLQSNHPNQKALWSAHNFQEVLQSGILE